MLNMIRFELKLISDADMYFYFEKSVRGGGPYISKGCSKTSKKYLKSYDPYYMLRRE